MIDEPIFIKGRGLQKQEGELNKTGRCYERYMVEQPTLGLTNTPSLSTIDVDATLARLKGSRGVGVYSNGAILGGVQCASTWAGSRSTGGRCQTPDIFGLPLFFGGGRIPDIFFLGICPSRPLTGPFTES